MVSAPTNSSWTTQHCICSPLWVTAHKYGIRRQWQTGRPLFKTWQLAPWFSPSPNASSKPLLSVKTSTSHATFTFRLWAQVKTGHLFLGSYDRPWEHCVHSKCSWPIKSLLSQHCLLLSRSLWGSEWEWRRPEISCCVHVASGRALYGIKALERRLPVTQWPGKKSQRTRARHGHGAEGLDLISVTRDAQWGSSKHLSSPPCAFARRIAFTQRHLDCQQASSASQQIIPQVKLLFV